MSPNDERNAIVMFFAKISVVFLVLTVVCTLLATFGFAGLGVLVAEEIDQCRETAHRLTATDTAASCAAGSEMTWRDADTFVCTCPPTTVEAP